MGLFLVENLLHLSPIPQEQVRYRVTSFPPTRDCAHESILGAVRSKTARLFRYDRINLGPSGRK
jgi:hypothetical protein